jgi:hypothetical protein
MGPVNLPVWQGGRQAIAMRQSSGAGDKSPARRQERIFFSEEKKQKTFVSCACIAIEARCLRYRGVGCLQPTTSARAY